MAIIKKLFARLIYSVALPTAIIVGSLYIFNSYADITFLLATVFAFAIGSFSMYLVFKYWVSTEIEHETPEQQLMRYMIIFVINVAINTEIVYLLVTYLEVPLLTAQTVAAVIVAYESYYAYRSLVFRIEKQRVTVAQLAQKPADASALLPEQI